MPEKPVKPLTHGRRGDLTLRPKRVLRFSTRAGWRRWLERNHSTKQEALLAIHKRAPENSPFSAEDAVEEALCFGWIDGWFKPISSDHWVVRYAPRRSKSNWSKYNIARAWKLLSEGRMTPAGAAKLPRDALNVWLTFRPVPLLIDPRRSMIRFADERVDYLSKVRMPAATPNGKGGP